MFTQGAETDEAVLCSSTKSYAVRHAESTNSLFVLPSLEAGVIAASLHGVLEVRVCRPRLGRLRELLGQHPYRGKAADASISVPNHCSRASLETLIQCSDGELRAELEALGAFELRGLMRVCDVQFEHGLLELLLCLALEHGWNYGSIPMHEAQTQLEQADCDRVVAGSLLERYGQPNGDGVVRLDARKVSLFKARVLLQSRPVWIVSELFGSLANALPLSDYFPELKLADLFGFCIVEEKGALSSIRYFMADAADSLEDTFAQLFAARATWPIEQLLPYVTPLLAGASVEQVLLRFCFVNRMDPKNVTVSKR